MKNAISNMAQLVSFYDRNFTDRYVAYKENKTEETLRHLLKPLSDYIAVWLEAGESCVVGAGHLTMTYKLKESQGIHMQVKEKEKELELYIVTSTIITVDEVHFYNNIRQIYTVQADSVKLKDVVSIGMTSEIQYDAESWSEYMFDLKQKKDRLSSKDKEIIEDTKKAMLIYKELLGSNKSVDDHLQVYTQLGM